MSGPAPATDGGGTQRLLALTDGVFSIVMTLMVFNIALPKERPGDDLGRDLLALWPSFVAYGISFGLVGIYWSAHHSIFGFIRRTSHELIWFNIVFLAVVSLIPFSTTLVSTHHADRVALAVYGGNLVLIGLSLLPLWLHATRRRRLVDPALPASVVGYGVSRILGGTAGYTVATACSFLSPPAALVLFALVPLPYLVPSMTRRWLRLFGLGAPPVPAVETRGA